MGHYDDKRLKCSFCGNLIEECTCRPDDSRGNCPHCSKFYYYNSYEDKEFYEDVCKKTGDHFGGSNVAKSQLDVQIDGDHYKNFAIQPAEFSFKNKFNWHQGEIIKYVTRYNLKHGRDDLEKAKHLIEMLIEFEYDSP